jgi:hypothetical protein
VNRQSISAACFLLTVTVVGATAQITQGGSLAKQGASTPGNPPAQVVDLNTLVDRMEAAQRSNPARFHAYAVTREYQLFSADEREPDSTATARVNFFPPHVKNYVIENQTGNGRAEKIAKKILDHESDAARASEPPTLLDRSNYNFTYLGTAVVDNQPCYVLGLTPRRDDKNLVRGKAFIDTATYMPRLVDGDLAKTPSWWLKQVHLTLGFTQMNGMWLQGNTKAVADVRLLGRHTLVSRFVDFEVSQALAQNRSERVGAASASERNHRRARRPQALLGSGVLVSR